MTDERYAELRAARRALMEGFRDTLDEIDRLRVELDRCHAGFRKHSEAALALYGAIYATVEGCGIELPDGCSPFDAVRLMAEAFRKLNP